MLFCGSGRQCAVLSSAGWTIANDRHDLPLEQPDNGRYDGRYGNGQYGNGQYNGQYGNGNQAAQIGSQDGMNDGQADRRTGHSNRPTQGDNYKSASRGYNSSFGNLNQYKAAYRQGYVPAYQQGYNQGQGYRR